MRIAETARKHGLKDEDMRHAARHAIKRWPMDDNLAMLVGPDRAGNLLEVGVVNEDTDDPVIVHAMKCRQRFLPDQ